MSEQCCSAKSSSVRKNVGRDALHQYKPLIIILGISIVASYAVSLSGAVHWMNALMAFFLLFLSFLKLINVKGFARSFSQYDVLAKKVPLYAILYPFIELALALFLFSDLFPLYTNIVMAFVMLLGCIGVINVIKQGRNVQCGCVGTSFDLPVGRVTLAENLIMAVMALSNVAMLA